MTSFIRVLSSCSGTQGDETLTKCVTAPCMDIKTIGNLWCTGTPWQNLPSIALCHALVVIRPVFIILYFAFWLLLYLIVSLFFNDTKYFGNTSGRVRFKAIMGTFSLNWSHHSFRFPLFHSPKHKLWNSVKSISLHS